MKKTYKIEVDCANCANLMESEAKKTDGVANAVVNFMTQKMIVEFEEGKDPKENGLPQEKLLHVAAFQIYGRRQEL